MTPEEREQFGQINKAIMGLAGVPEQLDKLDERTQRIDDTLRRKQIADSEMKGQIETKLINVEDHITSVSKNLKTHIAEHWKWLLSTVGFVGVILGTAKYLAQ